MSALRAGIAVAGALLAGTVAVAAQENPKPASPDTASSSSASSSSTPFDDAAAPSTTYPAPPPPGPISTTPLTEPLHPSELPEGAPKKAKKPREPGFGDRTSFVLSLEQLFGILEQRLEEGDRGQGNTFSHQGAFPALTGSRIGLHAVARSGITGGMSLGAWAGKLLDADEKATKVFTFAPRIGLIGGFDRSFGYWVRTGFNVLIFDPGGSQNDRNSGRDSPAFYYFEFAAEAYLTWSPIPHVAVTFGPHFETSLYGRRNSKPIYHRSVGFMSGLTFEF